MALLYCYDQSVKIEKLLTSNSELKVDGILNWTLPAFGVKLSDGTNFNVCPSAGACASFCYARSGTYNFSNVKGRHIANLEYVLNQPDQWLAQMISEINTPKMAGKFVRIHDSGDFFSDYYLEMWLTIMRSANHVGFYAYTKQVSMFKRLVEPNCPANFRFLYSMGGKEDHLIDKERDRHSDVFPNEEAMIAAGYSNQDHSDLLAPLLPSMKIGIVANNIKHFNKKMAGRTFSELQGEIDQKRLLKLTKKNPDLVSRG